MIPLTPCLVVAAANAFVGLGEAAGDDRQRLAELFLREVKQPPGQPWCVALVYHIGYCSHFDHRTGRSSWPLPATESCAELGEDAKQVLESAPQDGDVFLLYSPMAKEFVHTGIVLSVDDVFPVADGQRYRCTTLEGKTIEDGSASVCTAVRRCRVFGAKDQFIRWVDLDGYKQQVA